MHIWMQPKTYSEGRIIGKGQRSSSMLSWILHHTLMGYGLVLVVDTVHQKLFFSFMFLIIKTDQKCKTRHKAL